MPSHSFRVYPNVCPCETDSFVLEFWNVRIVLIEQFLNWIVRTSTKNFLFLHYLQCSAIVLCLSEIFFIYLTEFMDLRFYRKCYISSYLVDYKFHSRPISPHCARGQKSVNCSQVMYARGIKEMRKQLFYFLIKLREWIHSFLFIRNFYVFYSYFSI